MEQFSSDEGHIRNDVSASGDGLLARLAVPDSDRVASNSGLSAERADVSCVLCDFHLLDLLTEGSTVSVGRERVSASSSLISFLLPIANCVPKLSGIPNGVLLGLFRSCPNGPRGIPLCRKVEKGRNRVYVVEGILLLGISNVPSTVLAGNSDLLGAFGHLGCGLAVMNKSLMFFVAGPSALISVFLDSISRDLF